MSDVSGFAKVLDRIELMVYDTRSSKTNVGPNAPLRDDCAPSQFQFDSVESAMAQWTEANFPASRIVLGFAAYGHSFDVTPEAALNQTSRGLDMYRPIGGSQPVGSSDAPGDMGTDPCGNPYEISGVFTFEGLVSEGFLDLNGNANYNYAIDECSGTPLSSMFSLNNLKLISSKFSRAHSFPMMDWLGSMWDVTGDYNDISLDSLHSAIGIAD